MQIITIFYYAMHINRCIFDFVSYLLTCSSFSLIRYVDVTYEVEAAGEYKYSKYKIVF